MAKKKAAPRPSRNPPGNDTSPEGRKADTPDRKEYEYTPEEKYYRLKTKAVDDLVGATAENSPPVSADELRKYRSGPHVNLSDWVKAILLKVWFAGAICYFFVWGLSTFTLNQWDHMVIIGVALGAVTNLLTNNVYRFIAKKPGAYDRWMMVTSKKLLFLPLDLVYALALVFCVLMTYNTVNAAAAALTGTEGTVLGVEPILFGVFTTAWDLLFLGAKRMLLKIVSDAREKVRGA